MKEMISDYDIPPERRAGLPPKAGFGYALALYDNEPDSDAELTFHKGDTLKVLLMPVDRAGWWKCTKDGKEGLCPANRLKLLDSSRENARASAVIDSLVSSTVSPARPSKPTMREGSLIPDYDVPKPAQRGAVLAPSPTGSEDIPDYDIPRPFKSVFAGDEVFSSNSTHFRGHGYEPEQKPPNFSVFAGDDILGPAEIPDYDIPRGRNVPLMDEDDVSECREYFEDANRSMVSLGSAFSSLSLSAVSLRRSMFLGHGHGDRTLNCGSILSTHDRRLVSYVSSGADVVKSELLKAREFLANSASRCKPPPCLVADAKGVIVAVHRGVQLVSLLGRRAESETLIEFASGFAKELMDGMKDFKGSVEDVERYFPSAPVVNDMVGYADKVVGLMKEFCEVLGEVANIDDRDR